MCFREHNTASSQENTTPAFHLLLPHLPAHLPCSPPVTSASISTTAMAPVPLLDPPHPLHQATDAQPRWALPTGQQPLSTWQPSHSHPYLIHVAPTSTGQPGPGQQPTRARPSFFPLCARHPLARWRTDQAAVWWRQCQFLSPLSLTPRQTPTPSSSPARQPPAKPPEASADESKTAAVGNPKLNQLLDSATEHDSQPRPAPMAQCAASHSSLTERHKILHRLLQDSSPADAGKEPDIKKEPPTSPNAALIARGHGKEHQDHQLLRFLLDTDEKDLEDLPPPATLSLHTVKVKAEKKGSRENVPCDAAAAATTTTVSAVPCSPQSSDKPSPVFTSLFHYSYLMNESKYTMGKNIFKLFSLYMLLCYLMSCCLY